MKNFGFTINIDNNSNYIISHSEANWQHIRKNALINIGNDSNFYTIGYIEPINFITDFTIKDGNLLIYGNHENLFMLDDIITISYKEYELLTIKNILNNGENYHKGDLLSLEGGILSTDISNNKTYPTILEVEEIDGIGRINKLKIIHKGIYIQFPNKINKLNGGHGKNVEIEIENNLVINRKMIERQIVSANNENSYTNIELNYFIPENVTEGKISMNKYKGWLTANYIGPTQRNINYSIIVDRTPHLQLPFLVKNSNKLEECYNFTILKLEEEIRDLKEKINQLIKS